MKSSSLGSRLRLYRTKKGFTVRDVQKETGIDKGSISRYERDVNVPSIDTAKKFAECYGVKLSILVDN